MTNTVSDKANLAEPRGNLTLVTPTSKCICARILGTCLPADTDRVSGISYQGSTSEAGAEWQACAKAWRPEVSEAEPQTLPTAMPAGSLISVKGQVDPPWTTSFVSFSSKKSCRLQNWRVCAGHTYESEYWETGKTKSSACGRETP